VPVELLPFRPDLGALAAQFSRLFPCLLQSSGDSGWDILFASPRASQRFVTGQQQAFLDYLDQQWAQRSPDPVPDVHAPALPFRGGWCVYAGYEVLECFESSVPQRPPAPADFPVAWLARVPVALQYHRDTGNTYLFYEPDAQAEYAAVREVLSRPVVAIAAPLQWHDLQEEPAEQFMAGVEHIKDYIRAGDVFQVNLSRLWQVTLATSESAAVYAALRRANPAPFAAWLQWDDAAIISSSPERLARVRHLPDGFWLDTRPIAGTHPRSTDPQEDTALKQRLISSLKERAEHVMLIDLERNDLGRVCVPGTVQVDELMAVRSYAYVHHIESNIKGRLRAAIPPRDLLRAVFPGGTITGCPKVRTMQIIRQLEPAPRAAYTGSLGYLNHDGTLDLNILIRTFMQQGPLLRFRAGAGIVADSDAMREVQETRAKARGLLRALGVGT
jgi:anthranilate synthase component 1